MCKGTREGLVAGFPAACLALVTALLREPCGSGCLTSESAASSLVTGAFFRSERQSKTALVAEAAGWGEGRKEEGEKLGQGVGLGLAPKTHRGF